MGFVFALFFSFIGSTDKNVPENTGKFVDKILLKRVEFIDNKNYRLLEIPFSEKGTYITDLFNGRELLLKGFPHFFDKFGQFFNKRFGPDWKDKDKFFKEFEKSAGMKE